MSITSDLYSCSKKIGWHALEAKCWTTVVKDLYTHPVNELLETRPLLTTELLPR